MIVLTDRHQTSKSCNYLIYVYKNINRKYIGDDDIQQNNHDSPDNEYSNIMNIVTSLQKQHRPVAPSIS